MKKLMVNRQKFIFSILYILFTIALCSFVLTFDWFEYSSIKYQLDTFVYERMLDAGIYHQQLTLDNGLISLVSSEVLWASILVFINKFFGSNYIFFTLIPGIIFICYSFFINKKSTPFYIFLLLHPIAVMFYLNQLRLAFAFAVFFVLAAFIKDRKIFLIAPFLFLIHTSMAFFIFVFYLIDYIVRLKISEYKKLLYLVILGMISAFVTGPLGSLILGALGDRRADDYSSDQWQTSGLTSLYCAAFVIIIISNFIFVKSKKINFEMSTSIVFFSFVVISPVFTGGYPFRFLSAVFPIVIVSFYYLDGIFKISAITLIISVGIYMALYQMNIGNLIG